MSTEIPITISHECGSLCSWCSGSGEGLHDGSTCWHCKGQGYIGRGEVEITEYVEVDDGQIITEHCWCDECGEDLISTVLEAFNERNRAMEDGAEKIRTRFKYYRDGKNTVRVIVCDLEQGGHVAQGITLCSMTDMPNAKYGRMRALGRARKALKKGTITGSIMRSPRAYEVLAKCGVVDDFWGKPKVAYLGEVAAKAVASGA